MQLGGRGCGVGVLWVQLTELEDQSLGMKNMEEERTPQVCGLGNSVNPGGTGHDQEKGKESGLQIKRKSRFASGGCDTPFGAVLGRSGITDQKYRFYHF